MTELDNYLTYLDEADKPDLDKVKIHPKRKAVVSATVMGPLDDVAAISLGGAAKWRAAKAAGKTGKQFAGEVGKGLAVGTAVGLTGFAAYREIRSWFDSCTKTCGTFMVNTPKRQLCMLKCNKTMTEKQINFFKNKNLQNKIPPLQNKLAVINRKIVLMNQYLSKNPESNKGKK